MLRIATFNLENLFTRPVAMNQDTDAEGRQAIEDHATASAIVRKDVYSTGDKSKLLELTDKYGWHYLNPPENALVQLQKIRGQLFRRPQNAPVEVAALVPMELVVQAIRSTTSFYRPIASQVA